MKGSLADFIGVQEGVGFQFKGKEDTYKVEKNLLFIKYDDGTWEKSCIQLNSFIGCEIIKYQASDTEKVILSSLNESFINGWIIRGKDNDLFICENEPEINDEHVFYTRSGDIRRLPYEHMFNFVSPNLEAVKISDIL